MKIMLHICCGICAASVAERLQSEGHQVTGYFFNPNIYPDEEYQRRFEVAGQVAQWANIPLESAEYDPERWLKETLALAQEPEGGKRCEPCFRIRLTSTYEFMKLHNYEAFTTTLTVSPHKSAEVVNRVGQSIGGDRFLVRDFKKKDGFKRSNEIARQLAIYHQHYCGCVYSLNESNLRKT